MSTLHVVDMPCPLLERHIQLEVYLKLKSNVIKTRSGIKMIKIKIKTIKKEKCNKN